MPVGTAKRILNEMCSTRICVDEYKRGEIKGRIYNNFYSEAISFQNVMQMIKKLEKLYDGFEYPQKSVAVKSFGKAEENEILGQVALAQPVPQEKQGTVATFHIRVIFRKHASWQGTVLWIDKGKEESFRSTMELLLLLDSALAEEKV